MCDTLCAIGRAGTLFAKNSDRPASELQLPEVSGARPAGGRLRTQYLEIDEPGACAALLSRPHWLWGAEHGVNEHAVAIGNERVDTVSNAGSAAAALIGMDLVRLGLERASTADAALDAMVGLLERHGQGGCCDQVFAQAYDSSFVIADGASAWVLETAGRTWAAKSLHAGEAVAISNRLTLGRDWTRASGDVAEGTDFGEWRDRDVDSAYADVRLAASRSFLASGLEGGEVTTSLAARRMVAHLRDHGHGPWGQPGEEGDQRGDVAAVPSELGPRGSGITVCMHVGGAMVTTASLVALLPPAGDGPLRSWVAVGSPCVSVYVPLLGFPDQPSVGADARLWRQGADLRQRAEADPEVLPRVRAVLDPLEAELWDEADELVDGRERWAGFHRAAWRRVADTMSRLTARQ